MKVAGTPTLAVTFAGSDVSVPGHLTLFAVFAVFNKIALFWRGGMWYNIPRKLQ